MIGGNSTVEALSANNRSTTMATGTAIALTSAHSQSSALCKCEIYFKTIFKFTFCWVEC